jgi:phosphatidylserine decarboxylase
MFSNNRPLKDFLETLPLYLLPHHILSRGMFLLTRLTYRPLKNWVIDRFIHLYGVDMSIAQMPDPHAYPSFNAFFIRAVREEARPIQQAPDRWISPVDGAISQLGTIKQGQILQAKGKTFTLRQLLADDPDMTQAFTDGSFMTLYLAPHNYHRIHMPMDGRLLKTIYVPGRLFPVKPSTTRTVRNLFARNERLISLFETQAGPIALIMVGAIFVGCMETVWEGVITPAKDGQPRVRDYSGANSTPLHFSKGAEIGRFNMGSTVILLFGADRVEFITAAREGEPVQMGQALGRLARPRETYITSPV